MGKLWAVFRREYLERIRSRWFVFATVAGPLFFGSITIIPMVLTSRAKTSPEVSHVLVLDASGTDLGNRIAHGLSGGATGDTLGAVVWRVTPGGMASAERRAIAEVQAHRRIGYLVIDSGALRGSAVHYAGRNVSSIADVDLLTSVVRRSVLGQRLERAGLDPVQIAVLTNVNTKLEAERITERGREGSEEVAAIFAYGLAFTLYAMIVIYGNVILRGVAEEKSSRVSEVVVASASPDTLLAGKVLGVSSVALTQVIAWIAMSALVYQGRGVILHQFGIDAPAIRFPSISVGMAVALILFLILGFLAYAALFAGMGAMVSNQEDAMQAALPVTMLVVCAIVLVPSTLLEPMGALARGASWFPFTAPILMPVRMTIVQIPWYEVAGSLAGVAAGCAAAVWLAARIYRVGLLMYGKRPSVREVWRWVRAG